MRYAPALAGLAAILAAALVYSDNLPHSTTIPSTQQTLSVVISSPTDGSSAPIPTGQVPVQGSCSIDTPPGQPINVLYILDVSGSTDLNSMIAAGVAYVDANGNAVGSYITPDPGDNFNGPSGDIEAGEILDGEISGVIALHASLGNPSNVSVGVEAFATNGAAADVRPTSGTQVFVNPPQTDANAANGSDIPEVTRTFRSEGSGSIGQFTPIGTGVLGGNTSYKKALQTMNATLALFPSGQNIVFFLSDGESNVDGRCFTGACAAELTTAINAGTKIHTVAVGASADAQDLQYIATQTGGTFTPVTDPSRLAATLPTITPEGLDHVVVNGVSQPVDALGNFNPTLICPGPGPFTITATCVASDPEMTSVSSSITVTCFNRCGDGTVEIPWGEECEPPNSTTCDANCQRVPNCGDTFVDAPEECDPPNGLSCDSNCQTITCGNGTIEVGEDCEPPSQGLCGPNCQLSVCGNGQVEFGEQCELGECCMTCQYKPFGTPCVGIDDFNTCTDNKCNSVGACIPMAKPNNLICDDRDVCTIDESCQNGICTGVSGADTDGDGECDGKEIKCGCNHLDEKEGCLLPNRLIGKPGDRAAEALVTFYSPTVSRPNVPTDDSCATVGECTNGRCTKGQIRDVCTMDAECSQPPDTCRVLVNWAKIPDYLLEFSKIKRQGEGNFDIPEFLPVTPGCARRVDVLLGLQKSLLKLRARGTIDGRKRRDRDTIRYTQDQ